MKCKTAAAIYVCLDYRVLKKEVHFVFSDGVPESLGDLVELVRDDGFVLAALRTADFTRWYTSGDVLVLTNLPETEPLPEPTPAPPTDLEQLRADIDFVAIMAGVEL